MKPLNIVLPTNEAEANKNWEQMVSGFKTGSWPLTFGGAWTGTRYHVAGNTSAPIGQYFVCGPLVFFNIQFYAVNQNTFPAAATIDLPIGVALKGGYRQSDASYNVYADATLLDVCMLQDNSTLYFLNGGTVPMASNFKVQGFYFRE